VAEEKSQSAGDDQRLHAVIADYMKRRDAGQKVDQQSLLREFPDLADGLRSYFQGEAILEDPALAITRLGQLPVSPSAGRDTSVPGHAAAETASEFTARTFGRYQLLRPLGEGAMGSVYLAQDTTLDRRVALKMPRKVASGKTKDSAEFLQRFTREARAAAGLKHPSICSVYDAGEIEGTAYITMDFIDGVPLSGLIGTKRLRTVVDILKVLRIIADAVAHAHEKGIIHRDLKPGNILVDNQMNPFVTDFGLARREASADGSRITQEGLLIGTPAYMAPEQVRGEQARVGVTSDIYSLGVILFELLTARLPFEGSVPEMLAKVLRDAPPIPSRLRNDLTEDVDDVVLKMLQKEPERRYRSMKEVIEAIDRLAENLKTSAADEQTRVSQGTAEQARSPFEIRKAHIEQMLKKGQYASAIRDLQALMEEQAPAAKAVVEWARSTLPSAKKEAKALSPSGLKAMLTTAEQLFEKSDYMGCIQLLEDVPSLKRSEAMEVLLQKSQQCEVAAEELMEQIRDKERRENPEGLDVLVRKYLKLKPGNAYAKKLWTALQTYSAVPAPRRRYRFERGRLQPMPEISLFRRYALLAVLVGVLAFLATSAYVIVYLKSGSQTLAVHVDDEWLKAQGGQLTLVVDGDEHTISTTPTNSAPLTIVVKVGDREFSVKHGDAVVHNPRTFTIERDGKSVLQITPTDMELRSSPLIAWGQAVDRPENDSPMAGGSRSTGQARIRPLTELNSSGLDVSAWVSSDGLRIYWEHYDSAGSAGAIFQAERKSVTAPFENKREVLKGHQPTLTDDELEIVYLQSGTRGPKTLMKATRTSRSDVFSNGMEVDPGEPYVLCNSPSVSADGLSLTVNLKSTADNQSTRYVQLRRISRSAQWGGVEELRIQWDAEQQGSPLTWITMAADGLSFLATHEQDQGGFRILRFQRSAVDQPFEQYEYLKLPGIPEVYGRTPRYVDATKELFLTAPASYPTSRDANVWRNNYQGRLWVVENADLTATPQDSRLSHTGLETGAWVNLFDGEDVSGWSNLGPFRVAEGALLAESSKGFAVSRDAFGDFEFEAEWRLGPNTKGSGGVYYRSTLDQAGQTASGPEYQIIDDAVWEGIVRNELKKEWRPDMLTGSCYGLAASQRNGAKSVGEWNTTRIVCSGAKIEHWLNGELVVSADMTSTQWKTAVELLPAYHQKERYLPHLSGKILLQSTDGQIAFRSVRVRELRSSPISHSNLPASLSDLDRIASGVWLPLMSAKMDLPDPKQIKLSANSVEIDSANLDFKDIVVRDCVLRAEIRGVDGQGAALQMRTSVGEEGTRTYSGWHAGASRMGGDCFGLAKAAGGYVEFERKNTGQPVAEGDFVDLALATIGDTIILFVDGQEILRTKDSSYSEGYLTLASNGTKTEFRNPRYQILNSSEGNSAAPPEAEMNTRADSGMPVLLEAPFDEVTATSQTRLWAAKLNEPEEIEEAGIKLKLIPPGEFTMGSPDSEPYRDPNEGPQHTVRITQPFFMGLTEITQKQWVDVMETRPWQGQPNVTEGDNYPATYVDWIGVKEFCRRVSAKTGQQYRLPTEAEWEYACRAGTTTTWHFGDDVEGLDAHGWLDTNTHLIGNRYAHEVAKKQPNPFGLYDMHGNVFEWCEDFFVPNAYSRRTRSIDDPVVLAHAESFEMYVTRGGGFDWNGYNIRSALRGAAAPDFRSERDGFRVVRLCKTSPEVVRAEEPANAPFPALKARAYQQAWADHLQLPVHFTNSIGMKFRLIPPGSFTIGSTQEQIDAAKPYLHNGQDPARSERITSELPQQRITLTRPFYLSVTEVTQAQYSAVIGSNPSTFSDTGSAKDSVAGQDRTNCPVEMVSWMDTGEFCNRLSLHEGLESAYRISPDLITQTGFGGYRLPTEAEWEFACRAGTTTLFWSGDDAESLTHVAWFGNNNQGNVPKPVATKLANPFGLYDMHGNVWEWTHDAWRPDTYRGLIGPAAVDPRIDTGPENRRVIRGGDYFMLSAEQRSACRDGCFNDTYWDDVGFRTALSVEAVRFRLSQSP
jgi:formylglycine-generating enzyme required for sulfatase activity/serine/threonine protein kinase